MRQVLVGCLCAALLGACSPNPTPSVFAPGIDPNAAEVDGRIVGERLMANSEYELALEAFQRAAARDGFDAEILSAMGVANFRLGRLDQSISLFNRALALEPNWPGLLNNLGVALMETGAYAQAAGIFQKAVALDNGENDSIRENLRLALENHDQSQYSAEKNNEARQGSILITSTDDGQFP